ncbi:MAG: 3-oxoacyl-ACP synthase [Flavobacteriaceae bacterium]|nr:3-oxoacyl-ACP synthase [Flavobacteriaceae bacterium]
MKTNFHIESYCSIKENKVILNGDLIVKIDVKTYSEFIKHAYKAIDIKYPKFFKMDNLSKLAFVAAEVLLGKEPTNENKNIAIVFSNKASSLDTDRMHQETINSPEYYYPSPAIFVYTLPNICMGEISIKHKLLTENSFFIFNHFNAYYLHAYTNSLLQNKKTEKVLCGWINYDGEDYEAFVYLVSQKGYWQHTTEEITRLYTI